MAIFGTKTNQGIPPHRGGEEVADKHTKDLPLPLKEWKEHLDQRIASPNLGGRLAKETASHYFTYARLWYDDVVRPGEDLKSLPGDALLARTKEFLDSLAKRNTNTCRSVRSLLLSNFLPWCNETEYCQLSEESLASLAPLPYHKYSSPIVERFIKENQSITEASELSIEEVRYLFRSLHHWIATRHLGFDQANVKVDSRPLLERESSTMNGLNSEPSPTAWLLGTSVKLHEFLTTRRSPYPTQAAENFFKTFIQWATIAIDGAIQSAPANISPQIEDQRVANSTTRAVVPKLPPRPLLDRISERRGKISQQLLSVVPQRDFLIDHLIQLHGHTLADLTMLKVPPSVSPEFETLVTLYSAAREKGLKELHVNSASIYVPYFLSADGGTLVVTEDPVPVKKAVNAEAVVKEALSLITFLIRSEEIPFERLKGMRFEELRSSSFIKNSSRARVESYARMLQVSALRFYTIAHEGPGFAFPGADGESLTADS